MKKINLKFKSLSFWFLSFVLCFNTSCINQSNKCMNINKAEKSINNKENKKVDIDSEYKKLIKKYKKEELINNKKFVSGYFRNKQYIVIDCIIEQVAKYLENWNYKLLSLFNEKFDDESSLYINSLTCEKLLGEEFININKRTYNTYLNSEPNKKILTKNPLCLLQFLSKVKEHKKTKMSNNNSISKIKPENNFDFENSSFVYQIIFSFLKSLYEEKQSNIGDVGLVFINSIDNSDIFSFLCVEVYKITQNFDQLLIGKYSDNNFLFSKFLGQYVKSNNIENFLVGYQEISKIYKQKISNKEYMVKTVVTYLMGSYINAILKDRPELKGLITNILKKGKRSTNI